MAEPPYDPTISEPGSDPAFLAWSEALYGRHSTELTFQEIRRGVEALSAVYVERRDRLPRGAALDGAGKRAAFAVFYAPLHFLITRAVARAVGVGGKRLERVVDLGCGTGVGGAAVALEAGSRPSIVGVDVNRWSLDEARFTWRHFGLDGQARPGDAVRAAAGGAGTALVAAYTVNELAAGARDELLERFAAAARAGAAVLVLEPIAIRPLPWWETWRARFIELGGRADEWTVPMTLPPRLALLDKAAGLRHDRLKARSLYAGP
jgi:hypothetical protein